MSVEAIFNSVPVDESGERGEPVAKTAKKESTASKVKADPTERDFGDRLRKGDTNDRIAAFGDLVDEDDYGEDDKKGYEPTKVEKDKTPAPREQAEKKDQGKKDLDEKGAVADEEQGTEEGIETVEGDSDEPVVEKHKVKVDGQEMEVTLEELKAGYSGKQAISKRFTEFDKEKKSFQKEKEYLQGGIKHVQAEVQEIRQGFESVIGEYKKNGFLTKDPLQTVEMMLDKMGIDSYDFTRALFEYNLPEAAKFLEMDETQQEAYFAKKENAFLRKKDQTLAERTREAQASTQRQQQEFNLIKNAGLTVESYNDLYSELENLGDEEITTEKVVEYARLKPTWDKAGTLVSKTSRAGDIPLIQEVTRFLLEFPNTTEEEIISSINGQKEAEKVAKALKNKEEFTVKTKPKAKPTDFTDEDPDFDMEMFRNLRR